MSGLSRALMIAALLLLGLSGCGSERHWTATSTAVEVARLDCDSSVGDIMRQHGYPQHPSTGTPQYDYRTATYDKCMRDKGFDLE